MIPREGDLRRRVTSLIRAPRHRVHVTVPLSRKRISRALLVSGAESGASSGVEDSLTTWKRLTKTSKTGLFYSFWPLPFTSSAHQKLANRRAKEARFRRLSQSFPGSQRVFNSTTCPALRAGDKKSSRNSFSRQRHCDMYPVSWSAYKAGNTAA